MRSPPMRIRPMTTPPIPINLLHHPRPLPDPPTASLTSAPAQPALHAPLHQPSAPKPAPPPEVRFAQTNHESIVTSVRANLLPRGGSMQIRLDPPELGALQVTVEMRD